MKRRRLALASGLTLAALALGVGAYCGWFDDAVGWEEATGWSNIPSAERPAGTRLWDGGEDTPSLRWLGHAGFLLRWKGQQVLLDPNTNPWCTVSRRVLEKAGDLSSLGHVDAVLLSHAHYDHMDMPSLLSLRDVGRVILPAGAENYFERDRWAGSKFLGFQIGDCVAFGDLEVCAVPANHNGNRYHPFESSIDALGYIIRSEGDAIYFSGDTSFSNPFDEIARRHAPRVAILPIGAWLPSFPMKHYHLSPEEAVRAALLLGVETTVPCHMGTFTVSLDRPSWALPRFARAAAAANLHWLMPQLLSLDEAESNGADT